MAKKVRKKTKAELADPEFKKRAVSEGSVLIRSREECNKLTKSHHPWSGCMAKPPAAGLVLQSRTGNRDLLAGFNGTTESCHAMVQES